MNKRMNLTIIYLFILSFMLFIISSTSFVSAQNDDDWAYKSQNLKIDMKISSGFEVTGERIGSEISSVNAQLAFMPLQTWRQDVLDMQTAPHASTEDDKLNFRWNRPEIDEKYVYQVRAQMNTEHGLKRVSKKIKFPLSEKDIEEYSKYLAYTENIDTNQKIRNIASELAQGETDLYKLVFKISKWIKEDVEYDLSFSETLEKPSTTIETKHGVCDEITALFVSMLRSLNIPTKYVSGYAYTNLRTPAGFGPHAWAEVYFPDVGWVPFDITYNEFGYVDAAHIKLKESLDSGEYSAKYEWKGKYVTLKSDPLDFQAEVMEIGDSIDQRISLKSEFVKEKAGFGSYNIIKVKVTNLNNFYTGITVYATLSDELEYLGKNTQDIVLEPYESKTIYWTTKLSTELDEKYSYMVPVRIYLLDGLSSTANFTSTSRFNVYTLDEIQALADANLVMDNKEYSYDLLINCEMPMVNEDNTNYYYTNVSYDINCELKNSGNTILKEVDICQNGDCKNENFTLNEKRSVKFIKKFEKPGEHEIIISAKNDNVSAVSIINTNIYEPPKLTISTINNPGAVEFYDAFKVDFLIKRETKTPIKNVDVVLKRGSYKKEWELSDVNVDRRFMIDLNGYDLQNGENEFEILLRYKNHLNEDLEFSEMFIVNLDNASVVQRVWLYAEDMIREKSKFGLLSFAIFAFAIGGLIGFMLHGLNKMRLKRKHKKHTKSVLENDYDEDDDGDLSDTELEKAVYDVIDENEQLRKEKEQLEKEKKKLEHEKKKLEARHAGHDKTHGHEHHKKEHHVVEKESHGHHHHKTSNSEDNDENQHKGLEPPKKKSFFGKIGDALKGSSKGGENHTTQDHKEDNKGDVVHHMSKKLESNIKSEFEKMKDESEKNKEID